MEAMASGALVFVDRMFVPRCAGLCCVDWLYSIRYNTVLLLLCELLSEVIFRCVV